MTVRLYTLVEDNTGHMMSSETPVCDRHAKEFPWKGYSLILLRKPTTKQCRVCLQERARAVIE
jgi:hypothetical protein